ncbi:ribosomal protein S18-alanine N-acetyltransferase [bacterium]|nr:ribosomal protein S18-alanine N-acetyltransferase [bacterium]
MSDFKIKIEPMKKDQVDEVVEIEAKSFGNHHWSKSSFLQELSNGYAHYFTATDIETGKVAGYCGLWHILEEAHFSTISVSPDFRRKHIAEALLVQMINYCYENEIKYFTLEVRVSNTPAQNLYKKYGMKSLGARKGYYQDNNEDALIMWSENIFYDKFKTLFKENLDLLRGKIEVLTDEKTVI